MFRGKKKNKGESSNARYPTSPAPLHQSVDTALALHSEAGGQPYNTWAGGNGPSGGGGAADTMELRGGGGGGGGGGKQWDNEPLNLPQTGDDLQSGGGGKKKKSRFGFLRFGKKGSVSARKAIKSLEDKSPPNSPKGKGGGAKAEPDEEDVNPDPTCVEDLPEFLREKLGRSGLARKEIDDNWYLILAILQFVGKTRFNNPWKEKKKDMHGPTGRDFRGEIEGLFITDVNPNKLYKSIDMIGQGGFGSVYLMQSRKDGKKVAIKKMPHSNSKEERENSWEVGLLRECQHANVVVLYDCYAWQGECWMVMEYLEGGSLADAVAAIGSFKEEHTAYAARECLQALEYMHSRQFVHRDLKSANFVFTVDATVKIIDFGLGRDISRAEGCTMLGSPFWMSPEMINYDAHGAPSDIWSFAISMIEMLEGKPPNYHSSVRALYTTATVGIDISAYKFTKPCLEFLGRALTYDPRERATATELLQHEWLGSSCDRKAMQKLLRTIFVSDQLSIREFGM